MKNPVGKNPNASNNLVASGIYFCSDFKRKFMSFQDLLLKPEACAVRPKSVDSDACVELPRTPPVVRRAQK